MQRHFRYSLTCHVPNTQIRNKQSVNSGLLQFQQIVRQSGQIFVMGKNINRHIDLFAKSVRVSSRFCNFFNTEIIGKSPQPKHLTTQINGISAITQSYFTFFHISCRRQKLRLIFHSRHITSLLWSMNIFDCLQMLGISFRKTVMSVFFSNKV